MPTFRDFAASAALFALVACDGPTVSREAYPEPRLASADGSASAEAEVVLPPRAGLPAPATAGSSARPSDLPPAASSDIARLAADALAAQKALSGFGTKEVTREPDFYDIQVPAPARPKLKAAKTAMLALLEKVLADKAGEVLARTNEQLTKMVVTTLEANKITVQTGDSSMGDLVAVGVSHVPSHPDKLAIMFSLEGGHGGDDVASIVEVSGKSVRRLVDLRNDDYDSIRDARWISTFAVTPPDADGKWFVVDAHSHTWITSLWRGVTYRVLTPTGRADQPKTIFKASDSAYLGGEDGGSVAEIEPRAGGFIITYAAWDRLGGHHTRSYVRSYDVNGEDVKRVGPFVNSPADLLEELWKGNADLAPQLAVDSARPAAKVHAAMAGKDTDGHSQTISVDGNTEWVDVSALPAEVGVEFECAACVKFPKKVTYRAKRTSNGWLISDIKIP